jgi:threonylcarbamoyladenosine tRNA methylthiotransferase MtaB
MARRCTVGSFRALLAEARGAIRGLTVTTDLIGGFPGETEADFAAGLAFVEECRFAHAHVFPFSAREGTAAAQFGEQVAPQVRKARVRRLQEVVAATGRLERQRFAGTVRPVLWEGAGTPVGDPLGALPGAPEATLRLPQVGVRWTGLTDNYLRVEAVGPAGEVWRNRTMPVRLRAGLELAGGADAFFEIDADFVA